MNRGCNNYSIGLRLMVFLVLILVISGCVDEAGSQAEQGADVILQVQEVKDDLLDEAMRDVSPDDSLDGRIERFENPSWAQDKTPVTLDWYVTYEWFKKSYEPKINLGDMKLLEHTGISINLMTGSVDELNTMIANGELPDIITSSRKSISINEMESKGMLYPLDELIDQYAPEADVPKSMIDWYRASDGQWYRFVSFFSSEERVNDTYGGHSTSHNGNWVREDILEDIGMSVEDISTKKGFMEALLKVKEEQITYNGELVTPFVLDVWYGAVAVRFAEQFGVDYEDEEGNFVNIYRTPEYLEALLYMNEMYRLGLFTDEAFTMDKAQIDAKISRGTAFSANGWVTVRDGSKELWSSDPDAKMIYGGIIEGGDNGNEPIIMATNSDGWTATVITRESQHPDRAIQLLSYLSQEEIMLDIIYGTGTYEVIDGKAYKDQEIEKLEMEDVEAYDAKYNFNMGLLLDSQVSYRYNLITDNWYYNDSINAMISDDVAMCDSKAFSSVEPEAGTELERIRIKLQDYKDKVLPSIIMAKSAEECADLYDEYMEILDSIGMIEYDLYRNERFQENKKKLGITYAWPRYELED